MADVESPGTPVVAQEGGRTAGSGSVPGMSVARRALRDSAIVAQVHAGDAKSEIAAQHSLTVAQVNKILKRFNGSPTMMDSQPMEILERALRTYEEQMRDFRLMALDTLERAPAVSVAAMKGYADAFEKHVSLLRQLGKLPDNLTLFHREQQMLRFILQIEEKAHLVSAGEMELGELVEFLDRWGAEPSAVVGTYELEVGDGGEA